MSVEVKWSCDIDWTVRRDGRLSARAEVQQVFLILLSREALWQVRVPSHSASLAGKRDNSSLLFTGLKYEFLCFCCLPSPFMVMFHCTQNQWASRFLHGYLYIICTGCVLYLFPEYRGFVKLKTCYCGPSQVPLSGRLWYTVFRLEYGYFSSSSYSSSYHHRHHHHHHLLYAGYLYLYS